MASHKKPHRIKSIANAVRNSLAFGSIQQKLGVYAFIMSLLAVMSVSIFSYFYARIQIKDDREYLMLAQARQTATNLTDEINNMAEDLKLWREIRYLHDSLKKGQNEHANTFLKQIVMQRKYYDFVFTIDPEGRICAINSPGESLVGRHFGALLNTVPDSWLQNVLRSDHPITIEWQQLPEVNALKGRETGSTPEKLYQIGFAVAVEDADANEPLGALVAIISWSHFQSILDNVQKRFEALGLDTGYAYLTGNDCETLIGHKKREEYGKTATGDYKLYDLHEKFVENYEGIVSYEWIDGDKTVAVMNVNPSDQLGSQINWKLGVGINDEDIFAPIQRLALWFFLISLITAAVVGAVSLLFGKTVSMSLQEFTRLAKDASRGNFVKMAKTRSHDELGNLAQAFNEMLVSFRAQMPFVSIPNPYVVGTPIRTSKMFFGRQEDLSWLGDRLERDGNIMILLYGDRRVGKTSLLHQIYGNRASKKVLPFFFDTQQMIPEISQDSDFYHVLTRDMLSQIPESMPGIKTPFIAADRFTPQTFRNLLEFLKDIDPEKQPVLLFDEIENLEYKLARGELTSDILLFLAGLLDSSLRISFVVTGSDLLETRRLPDWNILVPKTISRKIGLLAYKDALQLIEEPAQGYFIYDDGIADRILRMTAGHPYYTQAICQTQIDFLNQSHEFAVGSQQLAKVLEIVLGNPPPPLNHVWESFSIPEKIAATISASELDNEMDYIGTEEMLKALPPEIRSLDGDRANFINAVENLVHQSWMERSEAGAYRFRIDLLRLWIRREHTIWHLVDELYQGTIR